MDLADFSLPLFNGPGFYSLDCFLAGKEGAVILFWSSVCSHCERYDHYLNHFAAQHPKLGFVTIASRMSETHGQMLSAIQSRGLTFPILLDDGAKIARLWHTQQTPRAYLLAPDRTVPYRGAIDNFRMPGDPEYLNYLEPAIASFLAGEPVARPETASFGCAIETVYYQLPKQL